MRPKSGLDVVMVEDIEEERPDFLESDLVIDINSPVGGCVGIRQ